MPALSWRFLLVMMVLFTESWFVAVADTKEIETHPVQIHYRPGKPSRCPAVVTLRAYEVYCHVYAPQEALVTGWCRGGFGIGELVAFLYARSFPKNEWRQRVDEALRGMSLAE